MIDSDEHSILPGYRINYVRKIFYDTGPAA